MENFNKLISFILGLVVVVVFLLIVSGKIDIRKRLIGQKISPTPTPQQEYYFQQPTPIITGTQYNNYQNRTQLTTNQPINARQIPSTGTPTLFLPFVFSSLGLGIMIKKKSNH